MALAGFVLLGFIGAVVWIGLGHPHTKVFSATFTGLLLLAGLACLVAPPGRRRHVMAVMACGAFLFRGTAVVVASAYALALPDTHHGIAARNLLLGLLTLAFFGWLPASQRRMYSAERALRPDVASKAAALTPAGRRMLAAYLHLADGRTVKGAVVDGYAHLPKGIPAALVVDLTPRRR